VVRELAQGAKLKMHALDVVCLSPVGEFGGLGHGNLTPTCSLLLRLVVGVFLELLQCAKPHYQDTSCRYGVFQ
jgi:hypothetical protein